MEGPEVSYTLADIQELNELAKSGTYDLIKVSCAALPPLLEQYHVLPIGAAIGFGCGPLLISKHPFPLTELSTKRVAIPGKDTTAHELLNRVAPKPAEKLFCLYHEIGEILEAGRADAGVIIHEQRFTFQEQGFVEIADLGKLWGRPIPLGCLVAKRELGGEVIDALRRSLALATQCSPMAYMKQHAQELEESVIQQHVDLYVTEETYNLSPKGAAAIAHLIQTPVEEFLFHASDCHCPSP